MAATAEFHALLVVGALLARYAASLGCEVLASAIAILLLVVWELLVAAQWGGFTASNTTPWIQILLGFTWIQTGILISLLIVLIRKTVPHEKCADSSSELRTSLLV